MGFVNLLLDTCTFLWLVQEPSELSPQAAQLLGDAGNNLFLSDTSIWEITLKHSRGKLPLPKAPRVWIPGKITRHRLQIIPITREALFRSGELPKVHPDPFDRLLAAQAMEGGLVLVSPDEPLSALGAARVW